MIQKINNPRGDIHVQSLYHDESSPSRIGRCVFGYYQVVTKVTYIRCIVFFLWQEFLKTHSNDLLWYIASFSPVIHFTVVILHCMLILKINLHCKDDIKRKTKMSFLFCISNLW